MQVSWRDFFKNIMGNVIVRHISYSESDHVKVCVQEGYTLKAQVKMEEHKVYIEIRQKENETEV